MSLFYSASARRPKRNLLTTVVEQPPQKKTKRNTSTSSASPTPSFSLLPDKILLECIARTSKSHYRSLSFVSKSIKSLLSSPELYPARSRIGNTEPCLYLCQEDRWYTLDRTLITTGWVKDELSLSPISCYSGLSKSTTVAVGFEIYQMGGTINDRRSSAVRVLDCRTHTWRDAPDMTVARTRALSCLIDGKIFVIGGAREKFPYIIGASSFVVGGTADASWGEVFDLKTQTWKPLMPCPISVAAAAKVFFDRGKLYAISEHISYEYDPKEGKWEESLDQVGFGGWGRSIPWCIIEDVKFSIVSDKFRWYDSDSRIWSAVKGLKDMYTKPFICKSSTIRLTNHGGKLVVLWDETRSLEFPVAGKKKYRSINKMFCCAVIRLEKRIGLKGLEIWGEMEWSNAVLRPSP